MPDAVPTTPRRASKLLAGSRSAAAPAESAVAVAIDEARLAGAITKATSPAIDIAWPVPSVFDRRDLAKSAAAFAAHVAVFLMLINPSGRIGGEGRDPESIGIEIVVVAPALESRDVDATRTTAADAVVVQSGSVAVPEEQDAARDSTKSESEQKAAASGTSVAGIEAPRADIVVPEWEERRLPTEAPAIEPVIAKDKGESEPIATGAIVRVPEKELLFSPSASTPAEALLPSPQGGAAARGRDSIDATATAALAAARTGVKDKYGSDVYAALRASPPQLAPGTPAADFARFVMVEFKLTGRGTLASARITLSSGRRAYDEAALGAIRRALFPAPPAEVGERDRVYTMEYTFR